MKKEEKIISDISSLPQNHPLRTKLTTSQRASDILSKCIGSWGFIILIIIFLIFWVSANIYAWINQWDPYPFILLNLVLACLTAIQTPIILMSQNRISQKDRIRTEYDYAVDRKSEREIEEIKKQLDRIERKIK
ncbi:DUF1003 domain-containing protein [Candidatus Pacearchaeota archaeon]|nr:DUF1003 domain-containing protein [Candidatus Pacearchaeota archaeon]